MPKYNIRFVDFATRAALFELHVEQDITVGALKAMAEEHLSNSDGLCPMKYFDKWYLEVRVGDRKKLVGIDEGDEGLALVAAGLEDESFVFLEGPMFEEGQTEVGRAIAAVRAQAKAQAAQHAFQVQVLMTEMGRRFDAMAAKQQEQSEAFNNGLKKQSEAIDKKFDTMADKQQEMSSMITTGQQRMDAMAKAQSDVSEELEGMLSGNSDKLEMLSAEMKQPTNKFKFDKRLEVLANEVAHIKYWTGIQRMKKLTAEVDSLLQQHSNRPLKAFWEVLNDEASPGMELPMAIIMDRRCGIERRAELADGPMKGGKGFIINTKDQEGATPLIMAVHACRNDVVSALLAIGTDYEATFGTNGMSALHIAAVINNVGAIELLASYGANVSKPYKGNLTPLHNAAYNGHAAAIEALVRLGADLTIANTSGHTPLQTFGTRPQAHLSGAEKERLKTSLARPPLDLDFWEPSNPVSEWIVKVAEKRA